LLRFIAGLLIFHSLKIVIWAQVYFWQRCFPEPRNGLLLLARELYDCGLWRPRACSSLATDGWLRSDGRGTTFRMVHGMPRGPYFSLPG
jgi:hypothetical protein